MARIDLTAAAYAELGLEALYAGNIPRAIGMLAAIDEESWKALRERFPGFPERIGSDLDAHALETVAVAAIESTRSPQDR